MVKIYYCIYLVINWTEMWDWRYIFGWFTWELSRIVVTGLKNIYILICDNLFLDNNYLLIVTFHPGRVYKSNHRLPVELRWISGQSYWIKSNQWISWHTIIILILIDTYLLANGWILGHFTLDRQHLHFVYCKWWINSFVSKRFKPGRD